MVYQRLLSTILALFRQVKWRVVLLSMLAGFANAELPKMHTIQQGVWRVIAISENGGKHYGTAFSVYKDYLFTANHVIYQDNGEPYPNITFHLDVDGEVHKVTDVLMTKGLCEQQRKGVCKKGYDTAVVQLKLLAELPVERFNITLDANYIRGFHGMLSGYPSGEDGIAHSNNGGFSIMNIHDVYRFQMSRIDENNPYYYRGFVQGRTGLSGGPVFNSHETRSVSSLMSLAKEQSSWSEPVFTVMNIGIVELLNYIPLDDKLRTQKELWRQDNVNFEQAKTFLMSISDMELYMYTRALLKDMEIEPEVPIYKPALLSALYDAIHVRRIDYVREDLANYVDVTNVLGWQRDLAKVKTKFASFYDRTGDVALSRQKFNEAIVLFKDYMHASQEKGYYGINVFDDSMEYLVQAYKGLGNEEYAEFYTNVGAYVGSPIALLAAGKLQLKAGNVDSAIDYLNASRVIGSGSTQLNAQEMITSLTGDSSEVAQPDDEQLLLNNIRTQMNIDATAELNGRKFNVKEAAIYLSPASVQGQLMDHQ